MSDLRPGIAPRSPKDSTPPDTPQVVGISSSKYGSGVAPVTEKAREHFRAAFAEDRAASAAFLIRTSTTLATLAQEPGYSRHRAVPGDKYGRSVRSRALFPGFGEGVERGAAESALVDKPSPDEGAAHAPGQLAGH